MTTQATEEPMVLSSGKVVYGNWQEFPGQPPRFNVTREVGLSQDFLNSLNNNTVPTRKANAGDGISFLRDYLRGTDYDQEEDDSLVARTIRYSPPNAILKTPHLDSPYMDQLIERGFRPLKPPGPKGPQLPYFL